MSKPKAIVWTRRRAKAAVAAIEAMLAGQDCEGDWPLDVKRADLEAASEKLKRIREGLKP